MEEVFYAEYEGKPVYKLDGDNYCMCDGCRAKGWLVALWTIGNCYEYDGKIYCEDCFQQLIKGETNEIITK